jgi:hypothetical protein
VEEAKARIGGESMVQGGIGLEVSIANDQAFPQRSVLLMGNAGQGLFQFRASFMGADHHGNLHVFGDSVPLLALTYENHL